MVHKSYGTWKVVPEMMQVNIPTYWDKKPKGAKKIGETKDFIRYARGNNRYIYVLKKGR
jgi:cytosine/adenosine deaminase-related metal-dependent hydrolase